MIYGKIKKVISCITLVAFFNFSVVQPANAVWSIGLVPVLQYFGVSQSLALGIEASTLLHTLLFAIGINLNRNSAGQDVTSNVATPPIEVRVNSKKALPTPQGWTPAVPPSVQPTAPSSAQPVNTRHWGNPYLYVDPVSGVTSYSYDMSAPILSHYKPTLLQACQEGLAHSQPQSVVDSANIVDGGCYALSACPSGYTVVTGGSSPTCSLSNSSLVQKPPEGKCIFLRTPSNSFVPDPQNSAECSAAIDPTKNGGHKISMNASTVTTEFRDGSKLTVQIGGDNKVTTTEDYPYDQSPGTTLRKITKLSIPDANGDVEIEGTSSSTFTGTGSLTGTGGTTSVTFDKTGLATETGQRDISDKLGQIDQKLNVTGTPSADTVTQDVEALKGPPDILNANTNIYDKGLIDHNMPLPVQTVDDCEPLALNFNGRLVNIDHCTPARKFHWVVDFSVGLMFAIAAFKDVFRRQEGV